jgi:hypothetical protein
VLLENLIFILTFVLLGPGTHSPVAATGSVIIQLVWAFTLGPLLVVSFKVAHGIWDNRIGQQAVGRSEAK